MPSISCKNLNSFLIGPPIDLPMVPMPSIQEYFRALNEKNKESQLVESEEDYDDEYYASTEEMGYDETNEEESTLPNNPETTIVAKDSEDTETTIGGSDTETETTSISSVSVFPKEAPTGKAGELLYWATKGDGSLLYTTVAGDNAFGSTNQESDDIENDALSKDNDTEENEANINDKSTNTSEDNAVTETLQTDTNAIEDTISTSRISDSTKKPEVNPKDSGTESPLADNDTTDIENESNTEIISTEQGE